MQTAVFTGSRLSPELVTVWSSIQESNPAIASPYFSPEFTLATASVRNDVYVAMVQEGSQIIGFFPFQRNAIGAGGPVASCFSDFHGFALQPEKQIDPLEIIRRCRLKVWDFDHIPGDQVAFAPFSRKIDGSRYMCLGNGYDHYCAERLKAGSEQIKKVLGLKRKFEREVGPLTIQEQLDDLGALDTLFRWKGAQYLASGWRDYFSLGWTKELLSTLLRTRTASFSGMLSVLSVGGELAAVHFGMRSRSVWHYWFPAYNMKYAKYSPGLILLLGIAERAPGLGVKRIDLGKGTEAYKDRFATGSIPVMEGSIEMPSVALVGRRVFGAIACFLERTSIDLPARLILRRLRKLKGQCMQGPGASWLHDNAA
jgi:CelD/BcsL family acetyltransferase involved in cellulose biosynthesis